MTTTADVTTTADRAPQRFDLIILGTGSGNSIPTDEMADWSIAIVEPGVFGGTCLNRGCIPSKMFVHAADVAHTISTASRLGVHGTFEGADWPAIRERVFRRIDPIAISGEAYRRGLSNVTVFDEPAAFLAPKVMQVGDATITAERIVLAVGSRPRIPDIEGIGAVAHHTSDTIMRLDDLPEHLLVIGGGAISAEMTHVFDAFGSRVSVLLRSACLLSDVEPEISEELTRHFEERGIDVHRSTTAHAVRQEDDGTITLSLSDGSELSGDCLLVAAGRVSNADTLALDAGGIRVDDDGIPIVDRYLQTSQAGVWALGDLIEHHHDLKHIANAHARAIQQTLLHPQFPIQPVVPNQPYAIFTEPEVATVGLTEADARAAGHDVSVGTRYYRDTAYGWALEDRHSFAKVVVDATDRSILGAHIIGPEASILIQPLVQAMTFGQTADQLARMVVWPHPALTEVVEQALLET